MKRFLCFVFGFITLFSKVCFADHIFLMSENEIENAKDIKIHSMYNDYEIETLKRIVHCEAKGEGELGQMAVASVILNRVDSESFPDSIVDVVYQKGQFCPTKSDSFESTVASNQVSKSVDKVLLGNRVVDSLYFKSTNSNASWTKLNFDTKIGGHLFYSK